MAKTLIIISVFLFLIIGCNHSENSGSAIVKQILKIRADKDLSFKHSKKSPIPDDQKKEFQGLSYFPVDLKYRFQLSLTQYKEKKNIKITTSTGQEREALKYGYFEINMDGTDCILHVYKMLDIQGQFSTYLFVPYLDMTSGKESYGGGRYLDFQENDSGFYVLDFNLSYSPSCAYGKAGYNCPIPPAENKLPVAIMAGEKNYLYSKH